jgi:hypothetical protein
VERTTNMPCMVVTLDVSKLSGWLNADACCRVEGRHGAMCGARCGPVWRREGVRARQLKRCMHGEGPSDSRLRGGQGTRGAHQKHALRVHNVGRVEAQRLVEGRRLLPTSGRVYGVAVVSW